MSQIPEKCSRCGAPISWEEGASIVKCDFCGYKNNLKLKDSSQSNKFLFKRLISIDRTAKKIRNTLKNKVLALAKKQKVLSNEKVELIYRNFDNFCFKRRNIVLIFGIPLGLIFISYLNDPHRTKYNKEWSEREENFKDNCRYYASRRSKTDFIARKEYSNCLEEYKTELKKDIKEKIEQNKAFKVAARNYQKLKDKKKLELEKIRKDNQIRREKERIKKERQANKNIRINKRLEKKLTKQISKKPENIHIRYKELADVRVELSKSIKIIGKRKESYDLRQLAIKDYNEALKLKPDYKEAYINRGIAKNYIFDLSGACDDWVQAFSYENNEKVKYLLNNKNCFSRYQKLALLNFQKNNYQKAINEFSKILDIWPERFFILYKRAQAKIELKDYKGAISDYTKAIEQNARRPDFYVERANAKIKLKDNEGAKKDYTKAIELKPNIASYYISRGELRVQSKDFENALLDYDKVLELEQDNKIAYRERGLIKLKLKNKEGYCEDIKKTISLGEENINKEQFKKNCQKKEIASKKQPQKVVLSEKAKYYLDRIKPLYRWKKDCKETIELTNLLLPLYKTDEVYSYRGKANQLCSNYKESINDYNRAIEINSVNSLYYSNLAKSKGMLKDYGGSLKDYNLAIKLDSTDSIYYGDRGLIKTKLGDDLGALSDFQKAISKFDCSGYRYNPRQCKIIKEGISYYPNSYKSRLFAEIGKIRIKSKDYVKAITPLNKSLSLGWGNSANLYRGIAKYELKDYESACSDWFSFSKKRKTGFLSYSYKYVVDPVKLRSVKHNGSSIYSLYKKYCK